MFDFDNLDVLAVFISALYLNFILCDFWEKALVWLIVEFLLSRF